jgi:hypothetical protein
MPRVLRCVAAAGRDSSVRVTTRSTSASVTARGGDRAGLVDEPVEAAAGDEPVPPRADGRGAEAEPPGDDAVVRLVGAGRHDAGASGEPLGTLGPAGERQELSSLVVGQDEGGLWARHARTIPTASPEREQIKWTSDSGH